MKIHFIKEYYYTSKIETHFKTICGKIRHVYTNLPTTEKKSAVTCKICGHIKHEYIKYKGYKYWYEYRLAKDRIDTCLATKDPKKYCNGFYLYSTKDPGSGKAFVVVKTNNPKYKIHK